MEKRIDARLSALYDALERRRMEQEAPVDALSQSLYEWGQELSGLDQLGKAALLAELNRDDPLNGALPLNLTISDVDRMIEAMAISGKKLFYSGE